MTTTLPAGVDLAAVLDEVRADARAIEHAVHAGQLPALGLVSDTAVAAQIAWSRLEAERAPGGLPALLTADYDDNPGAFPRRMLGALWRSAQIHGAEALWGELTAVHR